MGVAANGDWLVRIGAADPAPRARLVAFPFAGAGPSIFRAWRPLLSPAIDMAAVQLPGRERRFGEPLVTDAGHVAAAVATELERGRGVPLILFGHSMGAMLAFAVARELKNRGEPSPAALIVSAFAPEPSGDEDRINVRRLSDEEFLQELERLGGTPPSLLANQELMALLLPVLRADFQMVEDYGPVPAEAIDCPIVALGGSLDTKASAEAMDNWRTRTSSSFERYDFPGDHLFILDRKHKVAELIGGKIPSFCD